eukprot:g31951.t1
MVGVAVNFWGRYAFLNRNSGKFADATPFFNPVSRMATRTTGLKPLQDSEDFVTGKYKVVVRCNARESHALTAPAKRVLSPGEVVDVIEITSDGWAQHDFGYDVLLWCDGWAQHDFGWTLIRDDKGNILEHIAEKKSDFPPKATRERSVSNSSPGYFEENKVPAIKVGMTLGRSRSSSRSRSGSRTRVSVTSPSPPPSHTLQHKDKSNSPVIFENPFAEDSAGSRQRSKTPTKQARILLPQETRTRAATAPPAAKSSTSNPASSAAAKLAALSVNHGSNNRAWDPFGAEGATLAEPGDRDIPEPSPRRPGGQPAAAPDPFSELFDDPTTASYLILTRPGTSCSPDSTQTDSRLFCVAQLRSLTTAEDTIMAKQANYDLLFL